ncbi:hypothetical protein NYQ66_14985, partial [Aquibacillus koreensis]
MLQQQKELFRKNLFIFLSALLVITSVLTSLNITLVQASSITISNVSEIDYQEGDSPVQVAPNIEITGGGSYGDGYVKFGVAGSTSSETLALMQSNEPSNVNGEVSIVGKKVYLGSGSSYRQIGIVNSVHNGEGGQPLQIDFSTPLINAGFEEDVQKSSITSRNDIGKTQRITGWDITLGQYVVSPLKSGTQSTLLTSGTNYSDFRMQFEVQNSQKSIGNYALRLEARYWVNETAGTRGLVNPNYAVFHGPWAISDTFYAYQNDTIALDWSALNGGDDYDVYAFLENVGNGNEIELFYGRGKTQDWTTTEADIPADGSYRFKFISGSYDGTGGGLLGASLYIDNIRYFGNVVTDAVVQQAARLVTYKNSRPEPESQPKVLEIEIKNKDNGTATVTKELRNETLIRYAQGDSKESVTADLELLTEDRNGSRIEWLSDDETVINPETGEVTRPSHISGDQPVTLTAKTDNGTVEKEFVVIVKAGEAAPGLTLEVIAFEPVNPGKVELSVSDHPAENHEFYYRVVDDEPLPKNLNQKVDVVDWSLFINLRDQEVVAENGSYIEVIEVDASDLITKWEKIGPTDDGKPLQEALEATQIARVDAENALQRYTDASGDTGDTVYTDVESALNDITVFLATEPKDVPVINQETATLQAFIATLEAASALKEYKNAREAAETKIDKAEVAEKRFRDAEGDEEEQAFTAVRDARVALDNFIQTATPDDKQAIEDATSHLENLILTLDEASKQKEFENAKKNATSEQAFANASQSRYKDAGGEETVSEFIEVKEAKEALDALLTTATPEDTTEIIQATNNLKGAKNKLEEVTATIEFTNAKKVAEEVKEEAAASQTRFTKAGGEESLEAYRAVGEKKNALASLLNSAAVNDTQKIVEETTELKALVQELNKASKQKEFENAKNAAELIIDKADTAQTRYTKADGEETASAFIHVKEAKKAIENLLADATSDNTQAIEDAIDDLEEKIIALDEASAQKELENAKEAAKLANEQADASQERYTQAGGEERDAAYTAVKVAKQALATLLMTGTPSDTDEIINAIENLRDAKSTLDALSYTKELANAVRLAKEALDEAIDAQNRYITVGGEEEAKEYKAVREAKQEMDSLITNATPDDTFEIEECTDGLKALVVALHEFSDWKELDNAVKAAELMLEKTVVVETRYIEVGGEDKGEVYQGLKKSEEQLQALLTDPNPGDTQAIKEATTGLETAMIELEKESDLLELETAMDKAEILQEKVNNSLIRYTNAGGAETAEDYKVVSEAKEALEELLKGATTENTLKIIEETEKLNVLMHELDKISASKELMNAVRIARDMNEKASKAEIRYTNAGGEVTSDVYVVVSDAREALQALLAVAEPDDTLAIEVATETLSAAVAELEKASAARELANALDAAGEAKEQALKAQDRFAKAGGEETADENKSVVDALNKLETEILKDPQSVTEVEAATKELKAVIAELEKASAARELANALDAAGEAKEQAAKAQDRFAKADGEEAADENKSVVEALTNLEAELVKDPQNTEAIVGATKA